jgi:heterotetrameric sarcosine oxidase gamma subunit
MPGLGVSDLTGAQVTLIQGQAGDILQTHFPAIPARPGDLVEAGQGLLARLTATEFYLFGKSPAARLPSAAELDESFDQAKRFAHATDYTHGKAILKVNGAMAGELLSKLCGLDFYESAFPNMQVKQSSAAKIKTLIARCDEAGAPAYFLHVDRSLGQYFFEAVWDAGQEFEIAVRL